MHGIRPVRPLVTVSTCYRRLCAILELSPSIGGGACVHLTVPRPVPIRRSAGSTCFFLNVLAYMESMGLPGHAPLQALFILFRPLPAPSGDAPRSRPVRRTCRATCKRRVGHPVPSAQGSWRHPGFGLPESPETFAAATLSFRMAKVPSACVTDG